MTWSSCIPIMQNFFRVKTEKVMQIAESDDRKSREKNGCTVIMQNFFMSRLGSEVKYSK